MSEQAPKTFSNLLDRRHNCFGFLRFFFAVAVIFSHSHPIGGFGPEQINSAVSETYGSLAVSCFFIMSEFLTTASYASTTSLWRFFWNRIIRIIPGFWACLLIVAGVFAPLQYYYEKNTLSGLYEASAHFIWVNSQLRIYEYNVADLHAVHPFPLVWIGSLWSLVYEFQCYIFLAALGFFAVLRTARPVVVVLYLFSLGLFASELFYPGNVANIVPWFADPWMHKLWVYFLAGALIYLYREHIQIELRLAIGAIVTLLYALLFAPSIYPLAAQIALPYLLLYLASTIPFQNFDKRADFSYGIYLYGFPIQQLLVTCDVPRYGFWLYFIASLLLTLPVAMANHYFIERPCLKLKHAFTRKP